MIHIRPILSDDEMFESWGNRNVLSALKSFFSKQAAFAEGIKAGGDRMQREAEEYIQSQKAYYDHQIYDLDRQVSLSEGIIEKLRKGEGIIETSSSSFLPVSSIPPTIPPTPVTIHSPIVSTPTPSMGPSRTSPVSERAALPLRGQGPVSSPIKHDYLKGIPKAEITVTREDPEKEEKLRLANQELKTLNEREALYMEEINKANLQLANARSISEEERTRMKKTINDQQKTLEFAQREKQKLLTTIDELQGELEELAISGSETEEEQEEEEEEGSGSSSSPESSRYEAHQLDRRGKVIHSITSDVLKKTNEDYRALAKNEVSSLAGLLYHKSGKKIDLRTVLGEYKWKKGIYNWDENGVMQVGKGKDTWYIKKV